MIRPPTPTAAGGPLTDASSLRDADIAFLSAPSSGVDAHAFASEDEREALERIAAAAKLGDLDAFGRDGSGAALAELAKIRELQVNIFHDHMRFDVFHESLDVADMELNATFLADFQKKHAAKEKDLVAITAALDSLGAKMGDFHAANQSERMPSDPLASKHLPTHRLTLKDAFGKVIQSKRLDHQKLRQKVVDLAEDAVTEAKILHGVMPVQSPRVFFPDADDSMSSGGGAADKSPLSPPEPGDSDLQTLPPDV